MSPFLVPHSNFTLLGWEVWLNPERSFQMKIQRADGCIFMTELNNDQLYSPRLFRHWCVDRGLTYQGSDRDLQNLIGVLVRRTQGEEAPADRRAELEAIVAGIADDLGGAEWATNEHAAQLLQELVERWHPRARALFPL